MESLDFPQTGIQTQRLVVNRVYGWMTVGLLVTAAVAYATASVATLPYWLARNHWAFYGLLFAELGIVIWLSAASQRLSVGAATLLFLVYAALNGLTMSVIVLAYTAASIGATFLATAGMFGSMSVIGYSTEMDLTSLGALSMMGLIGLIIASIANLFMHNSGLESALTYIGIAVFVGLTAYDAQRIKRMAASADAGSSMAIYGALIIYLDFINLFFYLLRLTGRRRN